MNKNIRLLIVCLLFSGFLSAQQVSNTEFKTKTLAVFQNLDKNRIPHGILLDFGMEFTNLQAFNGTLTDSTYTSSQTITDIYKTLLMCRARQVNTGFITPQEYATRWYSQRAIGVMTLSGLYFKYNKFNDAAYPSKLNYSNTKFSDKFIGSTWQNPYDDKQLFAMTPAVTNYKGLDLKVKLPANLFLSNYPATVQNIQIDFSDGLGFRLVPYDQLINVSYTTANTYTWQYKITLTNGQTLLSHSKVVIENGLDDLSITCTPSTARVNVSARTSITGYKKVIITATTPYNNGHGSATLYIRFANNGTTIRKPLIVAEGFDTGVILAPENEGGDNTINTFLNKVNSSNSSALSGELDSYDIIYVDWNVGVDFIQKNAYVLEEVIKYVNAQKALAGSTTPNVIIGQSMGGLVARYALRDIELNRSFNHDTKLYISHDAPHLGANTPLSVQYSARHLRNLYINTPIPFAVGDIIVPMIFNFAEGFSNTINFFGGNTNVDTTITPLRAFSIADVPAARQMQYTWVSNTGAISNTIHDAWQQELSNLGYPQGYAGKPIRNIAIANGSECGITQVDNGNIMSYVKDAGRNTFLSSYIGLMDAVYGTLISRPDISIVGLFPGKSYWEIDFQSKYMTTLNQSKNIYHGSIKYKKKVLWFIPISITVTNKDVSQPTGVLPYDIYGGGVQRTDNSQLPLANIVSNGFGFIPTASALDIGKGTTLINDPEYRKSYIGAQPPIAPKNSPFQNFISNFNANNPQNNNSSHISFNRQNGDWLASELNSISNQSILPPSANCSFMCTGNSVSQITGNDAICSTGVFSVTTGANSYNWYLTEGANLVNITGTSTNSVIINRVNASSNGYITLNVNYGSGSCGYMTTTKRISVGTISPGSISGTTAVCRLVSYIYTANIPGGHKAGYSYRWTLPNAQWQIFSQVDNWINAGPAGGPGTNTAGQMLVEANNGCGWTVVGGLIAYPNPNCSTGYTYRIYPNPVNESNLLTIQKVEDDQTNTITDTSTRKAFSASTESVEVEIKDLTGNTRVPKKMLKNKSELDISVLKKGIYILLIYDKDEVSEQKIIVN